MWHQICDLITLDNETSKEVYSNCRTCGDELVKGQEIITIHQYYYCNKECLEMDIKRITLGE